MVYAVGTHIDLRESKKDELVKEKHKLYIPGTHVIFCLVESSLQILDIKLAVDNNLSYS